MCGGRQHSPQEENSELSLAAKAVCLHPNGYYQSWASTDSSAAVGPGHLTFWNAGDINSAQPRSRPRTQQWHSEQCPAQHKYLINIYQSFSGLFLVFFFIIAVAFFVKLYNPVCSLLNGVNNTLAVHETRPASLFQRKRRKTMFTSPPPPPRVPCGR